MVSDKNSENIFFRILQFSDTHLSADIDAELYGVNCHDTLRQVLKHAQEHVGPVALSLLTGDLVHDGSVVAYRRLLQLIESTGVQSYCLAGNHDDPEMMRTVLSSQYVSCPDYIVHQDWLIICVTTFWPGHESGRLPDGEADRIERLIADFSDYHVLLAMHHPPLATTMAWMDADVTLTNPAVVHHLVKEHAAIKAVVWGHAHQAFEAMIDGVLWAGCPSTMAQFKPGVVNFELDNVAPGFRTFDLYSDGSVTTSLFRLDTNPA